MITIKLGEAFVELVTDGKKLTAGLNDAEKQVIASTNAMSQKFKAIGTVMTAVGAVVIGSLGLMIKKTVDTGDAMWDMHLRTGIAVEELSALAYVAKQSGTDIEGLELGIKFLTKGIDDASKGTGTAKDAFTELGISIKDSEGNLRPALDVFKEAATKIAAIENPAKQSALAMELFGARSGTQLVPLLKLGGAGIDELMKKAEELGIVISTKDAQAADEFKDKMNDLKEVLGAAARSLANVLIPTLMEYAKKAVEIVKKIREWAEAHKPLVEMIIKLGATLGALAAVGGPIFLAISAILKMQTELLALKIAAAGPIAITVVIVGAAALGLIALSGYLKDLREEAYKTQIGLDKMTPVDLNIKIASVTSEIIELEKKLKSIDWGTENVEIATVKSLEYQTRINELNEQLGILQKGQSAVTTEITKTSEALQLSVGGFASVGLGIKAVINDFGNLSKVWKEKIGDALKTISDRIYELTHTEMENQIKKLDELKKAYLAMGAPIEQVIAWHNEERKKLKELEDAESGAIEKKKTLADAYKTVADRIFELTHTPMETAKRKLDEQKQAYIDLGMSIEEANKWYLEEIELLKKLYPELDKTKDKLKEAGKEIDTFGLIMKTQFAGATEQISMATIALSNFTKEGLIAAIVSVKMSFLPLIYDLQEAMAALSKMFFAGQMSAVDYNTLQIFYTKQLNDLYDAMNEKIKIMTEGLKEYQKLTGKVSGGTVGSFQTGTSYVPKTGLAMVHQGEKIIPAGQNTTNNSSYSPSIVVNVSGNGNVNEIKRAVQEALNESKRQFLRRGSELALGM